MLRPEVRHIFHTGRPTNFKLGTQTVSWRPASATSAMTVARSRDASAPTVSTAMAIHKAYTVIFFTRAGVYRVCRTRRPGKLSNQQQVAADTENRNCYYHKFQAKISTLWTQSIYIVNLYHHQDISRPIFKIIIKECPVQSSGLVLFTPLVQ